MGKYIFDNETGKRYEIHDDNDKKEDKTFEGILALILLGISPGLVVTQLTNINWYYCFIISPILIFLLKYFLNKINWIPSIDKKEVIIGIMMVFMALSLVAAFGIWTVTPHPQKY